MNINFAPADEKFIKSQVEAGYYSNATEFVRDAVRRARERSEDEFEKKRERLRAALQLGMDDVEAGRIVKYDKNFMKNSLREVRRLAAQGDAFDPDVVGPEGQEPWV